MNTWTTKKIKDICEIGRGRVISTQEIESKPGIYPVYSSQSFNKGQMGSIDTYDFDGEYITWTTDGAYAGTVFYRTGKFNCTNVCGTLKEKNGAADMRFLAYQLSCHAKQHVSYVGNPKLMNNVMAEIQLCLPEDKTEQIKISEILSTLDQAIEQIEAIIAKQRLIKTGLMQDLLTKGIDENGTVRSEATHEFKDSPLGRIPVDWEATTLELGCVRVTDGTHQQVKTTDAGVPFLYVSCVREGLILWDRAASIDSRTYEIISKGCEPKQGVVLYTVVGSYGYAALVESEEKFSFQRHIAYILPNQERLHSSFLMEWMNCKSIREHADKAALGNAQKTITLGELRKFPLLIPSKDEQARIVLLLSKQNVAIEKFRMSLDKLRNTKTGLMHDLLTGKVRVTDLQIAALTPKPI